MAKESIKHKRKAVYFEEGTYEALKLKLKSEGLTVSKWIRQCVKRKLNKNETKT